MKKQNNTAAIFLEFFIILFIAGLAISSFGHSFRAVQLPLIMCALTFVLVSIDLVQTFLRNRKDESKTSHASQARAVDPKLLMRLFGTVAAMLLTIALWRIIGYLFGSIVSITGIGLFFGIKNKLLLAVIAVVVPFLLYLIFSSFLGVPLPWGFLPMLF